MTNILTKNNQGTAITKIPVAILCGGKGTPLKEETGFRPKPMVTVGDRH
jgi:glucose-1-phosphate cytidylyltransferase